MCFTAFVVLGVDTVGRLLRADVRELLLAQQHREVIGRVVVEPEPGLAVLGQVRAHPGLAVPGLGRGTRGGQAPAPSSPSCSNIANRSKVSFSDGVRTVAPVP